MMAFLVVGVLGGILLLITVLLDDLFDGLFESVDFADGFLSGPAIAGFLTAFGFAGALASSAGLATVPSAGIGTLAGAAIGGIAGYLTRSIMRMPTDATPTTADLKGLDGVVVTAIPENSMGEIMVTVGGQPVKLTARSATPLTAGVPIVVVQTLSPTSVIVEPKE